MGEINSTFAEVLKEKELLKKGKQQTKGINLKKDVKKLIR